MGLLKYAILFVILAAIAAVFGFGNIAAGFADIAKILFGIFVVIGVVILILGLTIYKKVT